ncbi:MAG: DUF5060 domain-containing protein [Planctomycetota bacterium]
MHRAALIIAALLAAPLAAAEIPFPTPIEIRLPGEPAEGVLEGRWDFADCRRLQFQAGFHGKGAGMLLLQVFVVTDDFVQYQSTRAMSVPRGTSRLVAVDLAAGLEPCGQAAPWSVHAARRVIRIGVRVYGSMFNRGTVAITDMQTVTGRPPPALYDFTAGAAGPLLRLAFAVDGLPDPDGSAAVRVQGRLTSPAGVQLDADGYLAQTFDTPPGGRLIGVPRWQIDFRPPAASAYTAVITVTAPDFERVIGPLPVTFAPQPPPVPAPPPAPAWLVELEPGPAARLTTDGWQPLAEPPVFSPAWRPVIRWNDAWDFYHGLDGYNQPVMAAFDAFLAQAPAAGYIVLADDGELGDTGIYNWGFNPLNAQNGGPLEKLSGYFTAPRVAEDVRGRVRTMIARWGNRPAVKGFVIAHRLPGAGAVEWHRDLARFITEECHVAVPVYALHPQAVTPAIVEPVDTTRGWRLSTGIPSGGRVMGTEAGTVSAAGRFPGEIPLACVVSGAWAGMNHLLFDVTTPAEAPPHMRVLVYLRDQNWNWYEQLLPRPLRPGDVTTFLARLDQAAPWVPRGAAPPWSAYAPLKVRELGIRILGNDPTGSPLAFQVSNCTVAARAPAAKPGFAALRLERNTLPQYGRLNIDFDLTRIYRNPFDPACVAVDAEFTDPAGRTLSVPAFFNQPFTRALADDREALTPAGAPAWQARYTPVQPGAHTVRLVLRDGTGTVASDPIRFTVTPAETPGFVRKSGASWLAFDSGAFYYPIGMTIRSPADSRQPYPYPFKQYEGLGTYAYDAYFPKLAQNGMNWCRVWQCSWWCGLEWQDGWSGYGGMGFYNLANAWRFDHIVDLAAQNGVYLQVDTMNHGQLSINIDKEWDQNPFNAARGGFLKQPEDYFTDPRARQYHKNKLRYIVARWGYSPNVMAWTLLTEVEFTGEYFRFAFEKGDPPGSYPKTTAWHKEMAAYLKEIDPWKHLVGTHFSHPQRGGDIWKLPEIDFAESNVYTGFLQFGGFKLGHIGDGVETAINRYYHDIFRHYGNPVLIGEFGGHWSANSKDLLDSELHCGTWAMLMTPLAGSTGFWWWPHVHFTEQYGVYKAASQFMRGEDLRKLQLKRTQAAVAAIPPAPAPQGDEAPLALALKGPDTFWAWVYHPRAVARFLDTRNKTIPVERYAGDFQKGIPVHDMELVIPKLQPGTWQAEFWNTYTGQPIGTTTVTVTKDAPDIRIPLPAFTNDMAIKLKRTGV